MIYTLGETVIDIIIKSLDNSQLRPGGSMLNTAVSLGRLKVAVEHISILSTDMASELLINFLEVNGVSTRNVHRISNLKTNLALAFLDQYNNASYSFYKDKSPQTPILNFPITQQKDIILFGSFFCLTPEIHPQLTKWLQQSKQNQVLIIYDPNFRKPHLPQLSSLMPLIEQNFKLADIIKASDEDLENIFNIHGVDHAWEIIRPYQPKGLIYTMGKKGAWLVNDKYRVFVKAKTIEPLSTIGAGDTFSAGILYYLNQMHNKQKKMDSFSKSDWTHCLELANEFAAQTCQSYDNYLSVEYANMITNV